MKIIDLKKTKDGVYVPVGEVKNVRPKEEKTAHKTMKKSNRIIKKVAKQERREQIVVEDPVVDFFDGISMVADLLSGKRR